MFIPCPGAGAAGASTVLGVTVGGVTPDTAGAGAAGTPGITGAAAGAGAGDTGA